MSINTNIIHFPDKIKQLQEAREKKYKFIRDDIEKILIKYSNMYDDEWAVILAAGRFASMKLQQIEGSEKSLKFFKECIETQASNITNQ